MELVLAIVCIGLIVVGVRFFFGLTKKMINNAIPALIASSILALVALILGIVLQNADESNFKTLAILCAVSSSLAHVISSGHKWVLSRDDKIHFSDITGLLAKTALTLFIVGGLFVVFGYLGKMYPVFIVVPVFVIFVVIRQTIRDFKKN